MKSKTLCLLSLLAMTACSSGYKSTWDCPLDKGVGCSSLEYADSIAREQIILNTKASIKKKVLINEDTLGGHSISEVEIN
ncbi:hypothetical protein H1Q59_05480 [Holosporaceae bacterium 'Namur']|nr:hypothetical protein [Holosporaceae bacterium 'Namur']